MAAVWRREEGAPEEVQEEKEKEEPRWPG